MQVVMNYTALVLPVLPKPGEEGIYYAFIAAKCIFACGFFVWKGPRPLFLREKVDGRRNLERRSDLGVT